MGNRNFIPDLKDYKCAILFHNTTIDNIKEKIKEYIDIDSLHTYSTPKGEKDFLEAVQYRMKKRFNVELNPNNEEYQQALMVLVKKVRAMKANYARAMQYNSANNNNNMCGGNGGSQTNNMCGGAGNGGGGIDPNILNMFMSANGGNPMGGANPMNGASPMPGANPADAMNAANNANPMGNIANMMNSMGGMGGGNPMQNMLMQSLMSGGNGMNMCGNSGGGGMC